MYKAIASNKRNTILIMSLFVGIIGAIGYAVSWYYGDASIFYWVIIVAIIYSLIQYFAAGKLSMVATGASPIEKRDNPRLYRIVENLAISLGVPVPQICVINDLAPNAFATGRDPKHAIVGVTTGLMDIMDDDELTAVMAHEMSHVRNYDIRVSMIAFGLTSVIGLLADIVLRMMFYGNSRNSNSNPVALVVGLVVIILSPIIASIVQLAVSRQREYLADASGVMTTRYPEAMISAFEKLKEYGRPMRKQTSSAAHLFISNPLKSNFFGKLFSTHPPLDDRIARLRSSAGKF